MMSWFNVDNDDHAAATYDADDGEADDDDNGDDDEKKDGQTSQELWELCHD